MKIALYQNHSKNNTELFQLTLPNHVKYCEEHEYDMMFPHTVYSRFLDVNLLRKAMENYDVVFCVGSDVVFTDIKTPLTKFIDGGDSVGYYVAEEGRSPTTEAWTNFDFNIYMNNPAGVAVINEIEMLEANRAAMRPPVPTLYGTQSTIDYMLRFIPEIRKMMRVHPPRAMQSLPHEYAIVGLNEYNKNNFWQPGDFSVHYIIGDNKWKYEKCKKFISEHLDIT